MTRRLSLLGAPYAWAARIRLWAYREGWLRRRRLPRPVVSVGNLTVGGTGKTPIVMEVVERLIAQGRLPAVLSRGYRRRSREAHLLVSDGATLLVGPDDAGDEPNLIARRCPQAVVAVGADRYALGQWVLGRLPVDCFVLDDGFQHVQLERDVDLLLLDATDRAGIQAALPIGRLREPLSAARRATLRLITRADDAADVGAVWQAVVRACGPLPPPLSVTFPARDFRRVGGEDVRPVEAFRGRSACLFSGIGNAGSFRRVIEDLGISPAEVTALPDHAHYTAAVMERIRAAASRLGIGLLITTEKDADKVAPWLRPTDDCWAVRLRTDMMGGEARLDDLLRGLWGPPQSGRHA